MKRKKNAIKKEQISTMSDGVLTKIFKKRNKKLSVSNI